MVSIERLVTRIMHVKCQCSVVLKNTSEDMKFFVTDRRMSFNSLLRKLYDITYCNYKF